MITLIWEFRIKWNRTEASLQHWLVQYLSMSCCSTRSSKTLIVEASAGQAILRSGMWLVFKEWTVLGGSLHTFNVHGQTQHQLVNNSQMNFSKAPLQNRTRSIAINGMSYLSSSTTTSVSEHACALKNTYEITLERSELLCTRSKAL